MSMSGPGDAMRLTPRWVIRQHEHTEYPVNDVGVTLVDSGDEMKTVIAGGVAAGASTGARLRRLDESAEIVVLERIRDMLNSDPMLFIRGDEAEEAWRIIDPVMNARTAGDVPTREYPAGQEDHAVGAPEGTIAGTGKVSQDRRGGR